MRKRHAEAVNYKLFGRLAPLPLRPPVQIAFPFVLFVAFCKNFWDAKVARNRTRDYKPKRLERKMRHNRSVVRWVFNSCSSSSSSSAKRSSSSVCSLPLHENQKAEGEGENEDEWSTKRHTPESLTSYDATGPDGKALMADHIIHHPLPFLRHGASILNTEASIFRRYALLAVLLAVVCAFAFQGSRGLYESTEGRYTLCAWEMVKSGNWLEPTLLGNHHWTKPPLGYWAIAGGLTLFPDAWGARLANSLAFGLTVLLVGLLAARLWNDRRTGVLAALIYGTAFFPVMTATTVNTDTLLCLWEVLAVFCFWAGMTASGRGGECRGKMLVAWAVAGPWATRLAQSLNWWMLGMWAAFGLGFFTKGPPALLPLLAIIVWNCSRPKAERGWGALFHPVGVVLFLTLGFWWFLVMVVRHPELLDYFLKKEVAARITSNEFGRNPQWYAPLKLYVPLLLFGGGLWTVYFWRPLVCASGWAKTGNWTALWRASGPKLFLLLWLLLPLAVFCLSKSRLPTYVLPLFVPVALAVARLARKADWNDAVPRRRILVLALTSAALLVAAKGVAGSTPEIARFLNRHDHQIVGIPVPLQLEDDIKRNMGDLYRVCQPFDHGGGTRFLLVNETELLGFDFYAQAPVIRVTLGDAPAAPSRLVSLDRLLSSGNSGKCLVVICKTNMLPDLQETLKRRGLGLHSCQVWCDRTVAQLVPLP